MLARKDKNLASFGEVASVVNNNVNKNINNDANNNDHITNKNNVSDNNNVNANNDVIDNNKNTDESLLDSIIKGNKKKSNDAVLTGIYLKKPLSDILNQLGKKGGKGAKSRIVNELLEKAFKEKGLL